MFHRFSPIIQHFTWLFIISFTYRNNSGAQRHAICRKGAAECTRRIQRRKLSAILSPDFVLITSTVIRESANSFVRTRSILKCMRNLIPLTGRPDMVHNCTISNTSTNSFSVRCAEGFNGGLPQSFLLEVRESNSQELRANMTSPMPRFSVTHLEAGVLYQACIYAYNDKGRSEAMVVQAGTLRLPEKQLTSESGEWILSGNAAATKMTRHSCGAERKRIEGKSKAWI